MKKNLSLIGLILMSSLLISFTSCSGDSEEPLVVTPKSLSMHFEDTQQLNADGATSWISNDEFVAKVNSSGLVTGNHVGKTEIVVSDGNRTTTCDVTITPEYYLYDDPILEWGTSKSIIESSEKHEKATSSSADVLTYNYSFGTNACAMGYSFENGKLKSVMAMMAYSLYLKTGYYLLERYQPIASGNDYDYLLVDALKPEKCKNAIYFRSYTSGKNTYTTVMYMDYSSLSSSKTRSSQVYNEEFEKMQEELVNILKNK